MSTEMMRAYAERYPTATAVVRDRQKHQSDSTLDRLLWESIGTPHSLDIDDQPPGIYHLFNDGDMRTYSHREALEYTHEGSLVVVRRDPRYAPTTDERFPDVKNYAVTTADVITGTITSWPITRVERLHDPFTRVYRGTKIMLETAERPADIVSPRSDFGEQLDELLHNNREARYARQETPYVELTFSGNWFSPDGLHREMLVGKIALDANPDIFKPGKTTDLLADVAMIETKLPFESTPIPVQ
jgi:hypothetical protein